MKRHRDIYEQVTSFQKVKTSNHLKYVSLILGVLIAANTSFAQTAYVTNEYGYSVSVINVATNLVATTINLDFMPTDVFASPDGRKVYINNYSGGEIAVINTATNTVSSTISVGNFPVGLFVSPDGTKLYVINEGPYISVINTANDSISATISIGYVYGAGISIGMCASSDGNTLYVPSVSYNTIAVINEATNTSLSIPVGEGPIDVCLSPDGGKLYAISFDQMSSRGMVSVINTSTDSVSSTIFLDDAIYGPMCLNPDGSKLYVVSNAGFVTVINTGNNMVVDTVMVGFSPQGISVSPDGSEVYVVNQGNYNVDNSKGTVSVINTVTNTVSSTITVGELANGFGSFISTYKQPTGIASPKIEATGASIYPNPFTSRATIYFKEEEKNASIRIMDIDGKELKSFCFTGIQLTLEQGELSKGVYFLQIADDKGSIENKKIVIQ